MKYLVVKDRGDVARSFVAQDTLRIPLEQTPNWQTSKFSHVFDKLLSRSVPVTHCGTSHGLRFVSRQLILSSDSLHS